MVPCSVSATNTDPSLRVSVEIVLADFEIVRGELLPGIERQPVQVFDRAEPALIGDQPVGVRAGRVPIACESHPPRGRAGPIAVFLERVHHKAVAVAGQRTGERGAVALLNDHARHAGNQFGVDKCGGATPVGRFRQQSDVRRHVIPLDDPLEAEEEQPDAVALSGPAPEH